MYHVFPSIIFCLTNPKTSEGSPSVFRKTLSYRKSCKRGGGVASWFCRFVCLIKPKNLVGGPMRFRNVVIRKKIMNKREMEVGYHVLLSEMFCRAVPEKFVGEPFCVLKASGNESFHALGGVAWQFYRNFLSHVTKELSCLRNVLIWQKTYGQEGGYHAHPSDFF